MRLRQVTAILLVAAVFLAARVDASPIYAGVGYSVDLATSNNVPTSVPAGALKLVEFTASALDFSGDCAGCYNIGGFLGSGGSLLSTTYFNGANAATDPTQTMWEYTGSALWTNGQTYSVLHDDGVRLFVDEASVFSSPLATAPITDLFTYAGPTGVFPFVFLHTNCCVTEIDFQMPLDAAPDTVPVPEPASLTLLGTGLLALARSRQRRRRQGR